MPLMSVINLNKYWLLGVCMLLLSGCMPPEVWKKPGADTAEEARIRKACYKLAEGDGVSTNSEVTVRFDNCMKNSGFLKVPQWQNNN